MAQAQDEFVRTMIDQNTNNRKPVVSGFWQLRSETADDATLAAVLAVVVHRGMTEEPKRKVLPVRVS